MFNKDLILAVRELLERHFDALEVATKLKIDPAIIFAIIDQLY